MAQSSAGTVESSEIKELLPFGRNILIEPLETPTYKGVILLPDSVKEKAPVIGYIRGIGGKIDEDEMEGIKPGDKVIYGKYSGVEIRLDNNTRFIYLNVDDILGRVIGYNDVAEAH